MSAISRLKGFQDILPEDRPYWEKLTDIQTDLARKFGFQQIDVPILEDVNLFARGNGEASDFFVNKEMYMIEESDGDVIALRPEFTAGIVRSYVQNGMHNLPQPVKLFTFGPAFRRERQQANRFRQHNQFNCEILGETDPAADVEIMMLAMSVYRKIGYTDLAFQLNSTGCPKCKPVYVDALKNYLADHLDKLAPVDQERLKLNPLRILDTKEKGMNELLENAPHSVDYLCDDCSSHFEELKGLLDRLNQPYNINFRLVRGIDYYTKTVFEVIDDRIGAQSTLCGGGRYDGLSEAIGGPNTPGVGFGMGLERTIASMKSEGVEVPPLDEPNLFIAHFGGETKRAAVDLGMKLRWEGLGARVAFARDKRSMKSQMREANKYPIRFAIIIGEDELANGQVTVRPMNRDEGDQQPVAIADLVDWLKSRM